MRRLHGILAVVAMTAACIEATNNPGGSSDADVDAASDVAVDVAADTARPDVTADTAPTDIAADQAPADVAEDTAPADVTVDTAPVDVAVDTAPVDAATDAVSADVALDSAPADVATDVATDTARTDVAADTASADAGTDAARVDVATDAATADATTADATTADAAITDAATTDAATTDAAADAAADVPTGPSVELWLLRVGDGTAALTNAATPIVIERRASNGGTMLGASINLPIAASGTNRPITLSGTATSEGSLTRSVDGRYVTLAGYGSVPGLATVATSAADTVPRVVARVAIDGTVDSSTTLGGAFSANNVRGAVTADGESFWVAGTAASGALGGVQYAMRGASSAASIIATPSNVRAVNIFGSQLYGTSSTTNFYGVFAAGTGTPTATATATLLPGFATASGPSNYGFALLDRDPMVAGLDTAYVADDRAVASGGGVQRWTLVAGTWTLGATFNTGITSGVRGLAAWSEGANVAIAAVTAESTSRVVIFRDVPGATPGAASVVSSAPTNTQYRGVALAPSL